MSQAKKNALTLTNIRENVGGGGCGEFDASSVPVQVLDVVRKHDTGHHTVVRKSHFKRIAFRMTRDRTRDGEPRLHVVSAR